MTKEQREALQAYANGITSGVFRLDVAALLAAFDAAQRALRDVMPILADCDCIYSDRESPLCPCNAARAAIAATKEYRCRLAIAATSAQALPREPTEAMQRAMVDAMFDERGDLKWRELAKIARKGWRAAYDAAMPAKIDGGAKERLGLWQVQGYTATDAAQPPSAPAEKERGNE